MRLEHRGPSPEKDPTGCGVLLAGLGLFVAGVGFGALYLIAAVKAVW